MLDPNPGQVRESSLLNTSRPRRFTFNNILSVLLIVIPAGLAVYLLFGNGAKLLKQPVELNPPLLGLSFLIECSGLIFAVPVWHHILKTFGIHSSIKQDLVFYSYSSLATLLPGKIWALVSRTTLYRREGANPAAVAAASVVETLVFGIAACLTYLLTTLVTPQLALWKHPEVIILVFIAGLFLVQPKVVNKIVAWSLKKSNRQDKNFQINFGWNHLLIWLGLEIVVIIIGGVALFTLLASLTQVTFQQFFIVLASWSAAIAVSNLLFWLVGTAILRDGAMVLALAPSISTPAAVLFVSIVRLWTIGSLLLLAGILWLLFDFSGFLQGRNNPKALL